MEQPVDTKPEPGPRTYVAKQKLLRCVEWLHAQNNEESKKSLKNSNCNDIQFILETNSQRKNFLISAADDVVTVPTAVDEIDVRPEDVPLMKLRVDSLRLECEWPFCHSVDSDYNQFQKHVRQHITDLHILDTEGKKEYVCLWDVCGHKSVDFNEMIRHINYHAYHAKLMAVGFNGRATLKLLRCKKDSSKRNHLPPLLSIHSCLWFDCDAQFDAIQDLFDHMKYHVDLSKNVCSWAGCGYKTARRFTMMMHVRAHTGERFIACYHCGTHFVCNQKLGDHLRRQNADPSLGFICELCGSAHGSKYLLEQHSRRHVCMVACAQCPASAPSPAALALHVRYRHLRATAAHHCHHCQYRAITKSDLQKHINTHFKKKKRKKITTDDEGNGSDKDISDDDLSEDAFPKKVKEKRKYICHICPENDAKMFSIGTRLTRHLVKIHGAQWPFGHSRFRYQKCDDGFYRLTMTRLESLEVYNAITKGKTNSDHLFDDSLKFELVERAEATETTPKQFEIVIKKEKSEEQKIEIEMCDVDEEGNIINLETIKSDVVFA